MEYQIYPIDVESDFSTYNIPFGVYKDDGSITCCTRIGGYIIDLHVCQEFGLFNDLHLPKQIFFNRLLNDFISLGKPTTSKVRNKIIELFVDEDGLKVHNDWPVEVLRNAENVTMILPIHIGDYTDFYSSKEHATNVGIMFRDPENALLPNWLHLPVGYHGRASSIVVSGTDIKRPQGQTFPGDSSIPVFGPTKQLDFELEMAFVVGKNSELGAPVSTQEAKDYIFGMMLFNDWSARDIQKWEYVPLGPFLAKNFASTISPWIVTLDALDNFKVPAPPREKPILSYLELEENYNFDIHLNVLIKTDDGTESCICHSNYKYMYWTMHQQLAHHTVNGCNVRIGDLMASGTISGKTENSYGSMLELAWKGTKPLTLDNGQKRTFIQDGDTVILKGWCGEGNRKVGFGPCEGKIIPY
ncbi:MAG: fumarylacetoacetase [Saprospiraceae bacterium]